MPHGKVRELAAGVLIWLNVGRQMRAAIGDRPGQL